jgi:hypothetical protein
VSGQCNPDTKLEDSRCIVDTATGPSPDEQEATAFEEWLRTAA